MENHQSRVTIHMAASLDGFIARRDGRVDWLETSDRFEGGETLTPEAVQAFLKSIGCYVMGSRTYETADGTRWLTVQPFPLASTSQLRARKPQHATSWNRRSSSRKCRKSAPCAPLQPR
jgi:dihydrofolate reductase